MDDQSGSKPELCRSLTSASKSTLSSMTGQTGSATEVRGFSQEISTEHTELSSVFARFDPHARAQSEGQSAASIFGQTSVEKEQPKPLCALLPASIEACVVSEGSQSVTSIKKSQESLKTMTDHTEAKEDDLCAAVLLACLFCHPVDCVLAAVRGCNTCLWWLCSSLCGCKPTALQPVVDVVHQCNPCECLGIQCKTCECSMCDICLQATECLDLAMEISQMLYH